MKKIFLILWVLIIAQGSFCQNFVKNGGFESRQDQSPLGNTGACQPCVTGPQSNNNEFLNATWSETPMNGNNYLCTPNTVNFSSGKIDYWHSAHGSPEGFYNGEPRTGSGWAYLYQFPGQNNVPSEGIFQNISTIKKNTSVRLIFYKKSPWRLTDPGIVTVELATGLVNAGEFCLINSINYPTFVHPTPKQVPTKRQQISYSVTAVANDWYKCEAIFVANDDYDQLYFYANNFEANPFIWYRNSVCAPVCIDDIGLFHNFECCIQNKTYQNIINPSSTFVHDFILAGNNVTTALAQGAVIYDIGFSRKWTANNSIRIKNGFYVSPYTSFNAKLLNCNYNELNIDLTPVLIGACSLKIVSSICTSSASNTLSYAWKINGNSVTIASNLPQNEINLSLYNITTDDITVELTVTDPVSGAVVTKSIKVNKCNCPLIDMSSGWPNDEIEYCPTSNSSQCYKIGPSRITKGVNYTWTCSDANKLSWLDNTTIATPKLCIPPGSSIPANLTYTLTAVVPNRAECTKILSIHITCCTSIPFNYTPTKYYACPGECFDFNNLTPPTPNNYFSYAWTSPCSTYVSYLNNLNIAAPTFCLPGAYIVPCPGVNLTSSFDYTVTATDACGNEQATTISIWPINTDDFSITSNQSFNYYTSSSSLQVAFNFASFLSGIIHDFGYITDINIDIVDNNTSQIIANKTLHQGSDYFGEPPSSMLTSIATPSLNCNGGSYSIRIYVKTKCSANFKMKLDTQFTLNCI